MKTRSQRRLLAILVSVCLTLTVLACSPEPVIEEEHTESLTEIELTAEAQQVADIRIARAEERAIAQVLETTGVVTAAQNRIAHVRPLARGIVSSIEVQLGDRVVAGEKLLEYDNIEMGDLKGEYVSIVAGLARTEARRNVAETLRARAEALLEVEAISRSEFDIRHAEYQQTLANLDAQGAELLRVEEKLHRFGMTEEDVEALRSLEADAHRTASLDNLVAPFDGVITYFDASLGEIVDRERELFTIVDTSTVWVIADVYEEDVGAVAEGSQVRITLPSFPDEEFGGTIDYISDFLHPESRTAKVRVVVENADRRLKLEMFGTVEIPVHLASAAVAVPVIALQEIEGQTIVFVQQTPARFERRAIRLGARGQEWVEVLEGLRSGESVVTEGSYYLKSTVLRGSIGEEH